MDLLDAFVFICFYFLLTSSHIFNCFFLLFCFLWFWELKLNFFIQGLSTSYCEENAQHSADRVACRKMARFKKKKSFIPLLLISCYWLKFAISNSKIFTCWRRMLSTFSTTPVTLSICIDSSLTKNIRCYFSHFSRDAIISTPSTIFYIHFTKTDNT